MDINKTLEETPSLKARVTQEAEDIRLEWQTCKEFYANDEAKRVMTWKAENPDMKTTEIKYHINENEDLYGNRLKLVTMESKYRKKEKEVEALDDTFTSAKMLARLKISELGSIEFNK